MANGSGKRLGRYLLKSSLGQGGMGIVYLATDLRLKRDVAVKILPEEMMSDAKAVRRFLREARAVAKLNHPNVVAIHDVDELDGCCFLVMELLSGGTAQDLIAQGTIAWEEATVIIAQACRGLQAAHEAGLIHRDIKPSNLMRAADGSFKVTDFGLAMIADPALAAKTQSLTEVDTVLGTPDYMSPEQCQNEQLDARSDIYSLGATYFALLTGQPPFAGAPPLQVMFAHCSTAPPDPRTLRKGIPAPCAQIVLKALAKNRASRFPSMKAMMLELEKVLVSLPTQALRDQEVLPVYHAPETEGTPTVNLRPAPKQPIQSLSHHQPQTARKSVLTRLAPTPARRAAVMMIAGTCLLVLLSLAAWKWFEFTYPRNDPGPRGPGDPGAEKAITLKVAGEVPGLNTAISGAVVSPDGKSLYTGSMNGEVCQWDINKGEGVNPTLVRRFTGTNGGLRAIAVNRRWLVAGGEARTVWLWSLDAEKPAATLPDFTGEISALVISPDGRRLAVGSYAEVRLYDLDDTGARLFKVLGTSTTGAVKCYMVMSVAFSSDSRWVAATTWTDKSIAVWDASTGAVRAVNQKQTDDPMAVAFLPGGDKVLFGLHHDGVRIWDVKAGTVRTVSNSAGTHVRALAVTPDGRTALTVGDWGGSVRLFDLRLDAPGHVVPLSSGTATLTVAISADQRRVATAGGDVATRRGALHLWNVVPKSKE